MASGNRSVVQRTWGLHELEARCLSHRLQAKTNAIDNPDALKEQRRLTYGPQFKYDEFIIMPNALIAVMFTVTFGIVLACLKSILPVGYLTPSIIFIDVFCF